MRATRAGRRPWIHAVPEPACSRAGSRTSHSFAPTTTKNKSQRRSRRPRPFWITPTRRISMSATHAYQRWKRRRFPRRAAGARCELRRGKTSGLCRLKRLWPQAVSQLLPRRLLRMVVGPDRFPILHPAVNGFADAIHPPCQKTAGLSPASPRVCEIRSRHAFYSARSGHCD